LNSKLAQLESILKGLGSALIAYSGGVDSTLLIAVAHKVLGEMAVAATAISPTCPEKEIEAAKALAAQIGIRHILINTRELEDPRFVANDKSRCYYCKKELFLNLAKIASEEGLRWVIDGSNYDDLKDHRPGRLAATELGVRSPLFEAGLSKSDIRAFAHKYSLPNWDKPSQACLASRLPYGTPITIDLLRRISQAEEVLHQLGVGQARVRHHGAIARIEVDPEDMALLTDDRKRAEVVAQFRTLGYTYVTLDLAGYRQGSMSEMPS